jgi:Ca2+-dependent lipid-binding protein
MCRNDQALLTAKTSSTDRNSSKAASIRVHLADGDTQLLHQVDALLVLDRPASRLEFFIDRLAGFGFEFSVLRDQLYHSLLLCLVVDIATKSSLIAWQS